jgi:hypothetical protein
VKKSGIVINPLPGRREMSDTTRSISVPSAMPDAISSTPNDAAGA